MKRLLGLASLSLLTLASSPVSATPEAHLLRIDPEASVLGGQPAITTIVDLSEPRRMNDVVGSCARLRGDDAINCASEALEKPGSLWQTVPFDPARVFLTVKVDGRDFEAPLLSHGTYGELSSAPGIGTAWLVVLDTDAHGSAALDEFAKVAEGFIRSMGKNDTMDLVLLGDNEVLADSGWLGADKKASLLETLKLGTVSDPSPGRTRPLLGLLQRTALDSFRGLHGVKDIEKTPLHQALVFLSSGFGGGDPKTTGPGAEQLRAALTEGREDNPLQPRMPIPVIAIATPPTGYDEYRQLAREFMQSLANPEIGGFSTTILDGQAAHAPRIVDTVRARFASMLVLKFRLSCLAPTVTQSFSLGFRGGPTPILGDASFKDVPVGIDPTTWPLDIDAEETRNAARRNDKLYPGGTLKVFGRFCWAGDTSRVEAYFIPPGEALPSSSGADPVATKKDFRKRLLGMDLRANTLASGDDFAEFTIPDQDTILHGEGENAVVRLVIVDRALGRTSGISDATVLSLRARPHPTPVLPILVAAGAVFFGLSGLGIYLSRSGKSKTRTSVLPPSHVDGSPYASPAPVTRVPRSEILKSRAILEGGGNRFVILNGSELRVGRDGARCAAVLSNPHISGLHATFRYEDGRVSVRDEGSSSGTRVDGRLLEAGRWTPLEPSSKLMLGPEPIEVKVSDI